MDTPCEMCKQPNGRPFLWIIESQREGTRERTHSFCTSCAAHTRHMCAGRVAEAWMSADVGHRVTVDISYEGLHTTIHDGRRSTGDRLRYLVLQRDRYCCQLCGATAQDGVRLAVDHRHPKSKGGQDTFENLWTLCYSCNAGKSDLPL